MYRVVFLMVLTCLGASTVLAQDPVKVDAKHYKVLLDNEQVRVLKIKYNPKEKSVMHEHPDSIAVFLNDSQTKFTLPDGSVMNMSGKAGEVRFTEAGKHLPENVGSTPLEVVLVELKGAPAVTSATVAIDPVTVDPEHHKVAFENDQMRVLRIHFKPHDKTKQHEHPNGVAVFLTDGHSKFTLADGKTRESAPKRGEATWAAAERHSVENMSDKPFEVILVELKTKPANTK